MLRQSHYRIILVTALVVLIGAVAFVRSRVHGLLHAVDTMGACEEANQSQTLSPDRRYIATVFVRDCGKAGYSTHVNLRGATDVLLADRRGLITAGEVVTTSGVASVTPRWVGNSELEVSLRGIAPLSINTSGSWNGVVIHAVDAGVHPPTPH